MNQLFYSFVYNSQDYSLKYIFDFFKDKIKNENLKFKFTIENNLIKTTINLFFTDNKKMNIAQNMATYAMQ